MTRSDALDVAILLWMHSPLYGLGLVVFTGGIALLVPEWAAAVQVLPTLSTGIYVLDGLIFIVGFDLLEYAVHRWLYHSRLLWWLHQWHHNGDRLWIGTTTRNVPLILVVQELWRAPAFVLLGGLDHLWWWAPLFFAHGLWTHCGRDWTAGPLEGLVVSPRWHAVHHLDEDGGHYGLIFAVWDRIGKTHSAAPRAWLGR